MAIKTKLHLINHLKRDKRTLIHVPLLCAVILSLAFALLTLGDLEPESPITLQRGCLLFVYGGVFFVAAYHFLNSIALRTHAGQRLVRHYRLTIADVYDISNKQVSAVQALFCCITGMTACTYSCRRDILRTSHHISEAYAWFGAAYFFYDVWSMYRVAAAKVTPPNRLTFIGYVCTNPVIVGHHLFIGAFGFLVITYLRGGLGDCFFGFVFLMEASTPLVSFRGILSKINMKETRLYVCNGLLMLIVFFCCRILMFPYVIMMYANAIGLDFISAIGTLPIGCKISIAILLLPQCYWFVLMLKGAVQVLKKKPKRTNQRNAHTS